MTNEKQSIDLVNPEDSPLSVPPPPFIYLIVNATYGGCYMSLDDHVDWYNSGGSTNPNVPQPTTATFIAWMPGAAPGCRLVANNYIYDQPNSPFKPALLTIESPDENGKGGSVAATNGAVIGIQIGDILYGKSTIRVGISILIVG